MSKSLHSTDVIDLLLFDFWHVHNIGEEFLEDVAAVGVRLIGDISPNEDGKGLIHLALAAFYHPNLAPLSRWSARWPITEQLILVLVRRTRNGTLVKEAS